MARYYHVAVCLGYGRDNPKLLVIGGLNFKNMRLSDVWMLDLDSGKWKEVTDEVAIPEAIHFLKLWPASAACRL